MTLISMVIALGRAFGMLTIAEGVETKEQLHMLRDLGCDQAQGYFFARPGPAAIVPTVMARLSCRSEELTGGSLVADVRASG